MNAQHTLFLYNSYHLNLAFSRIPESHYSFVIDTCYWPFLDFCEKHRVHSGFEITAYTLIEIQKRDRGFIKKLKELCQKGYAELIAAGYAQTIYPLIPAEVNLRNLEIGSSYYREIMGFVPEMIYVNEQCFSSGLVSLFLKAGFRSMIMEINNSRQALNYSKDLWYRPQTVEGNDGSRITVLWNNSISFQKFQRLAFGEISFSDYKNFLDQHRSDHEVRSFLFYGNDLEIFNYRPGNSDYLHQKNKGGEIEIIERCFEALAGDPGFEFMLPSGLIKKFSGDPKTVIHLESAETPLPTKKQDKYNPTRWAVTGRNNTFLNTKCYEIYNTLQKIKNHCTRKELTDYFELLNFCWASDLRTNTDDSKYFNGVMNLGWLSETVKKKETELALVTEDNAQILEECYDKPSITEDAASIKIDSEKIFLELNKNRGLTIRNLIFKEVSERPLIGTLEHGFYDDISFTPDFYSGHCIMYSDYESKFTDLQKADIIIGRNEKPGDFEINGRIPFGNGILWKKVIVGNGGTRVTIEYEFVLPKIRNNALRAGILTFNPCAFDCASLYYETVNGGFTSEIFYLGNKSFDHSGSIDMKISSSQCLGATEGWVIIGDSEKKIKITTDKSLFYSVPMIKFEFLHDTYFLRLFNSIFEFDETSHLSRRGILNFAVTIEACKNRTGDQTSPL